jgi:LysR family transcriptional regulator, nod-box dependent transcriptional activator
MAAILPSLLVILRGQRYGVRSMPVPFEMPLLEETLYWHKRNESDAGHRWMAQTLKEVVELLNL